MARCALEHATYITPVDALTNCIRQADKFESITYKCNKKVAQCRKCEVEYVRSYDIFIYMTNPDMIITKIKCLVHVVLYW